MRRLTFCFLLSALCFSLFACTRATDSPLPLGEGLGVRESVTPSPTSLALDRLDAQATKFAADAQSTQVERASILATEQSAQVTAQWQAKLDDHSFDVTATADALRAIVEAGNATAIARTNAYSDTIQRAQAESAKAQARAEQQRAEIAIETAHTLGAVVLWAVGVSITLTLLASGGVWLYFWWRRQKINTDAHHHERWAKVEQAQAEAQRAIAEAVRAAIIEVNGVKFIPRNGGLVPLLQLPSSTETPPSPAGRGVGGEGEILAPIDHSHAWRVALKKFIYAGIQHGFGERDLTIRNPVILNPKDGQPSSEGYRDLKELLEDMGIIAATVGKGTEWAGGWGPERFEREFDLMTLPLLPDNTPPEVRVTLRTPTLPHSHTSPHSSAPQTAPLTAEVAD
jgi:hypothetical protein